MRAVFLCIAFLVSGGDCQDDLDTSTTLPLTTTAEPEEAGVDCAAAATTLESCLASAKNNSGKEEEEPSEASEEATRAYDEARAACLADNDCEAPSANSSSPEASVAGDCVDRVLVARVLPSLRSCTGREDLGSALWKASRAIGASANSHGPRKAHRRRGNKAERDLVRSACPNKRARKAAKKCLRRARKSLRGGGRESPRRSRSERRQRRRGRNKTRRQAIKACNKALPKECRKGRRERGSEEAAKLCECAKSLGEMEGLAEELASCDNADATAEGDEEMPPLERFSRILCLQAEKARCHLIDAEIRRLAKPKRKNRKGKGRRRGRKERERDRLVDSVLGSF